MCSRSGATIPAAISKKVERIKELTKKSQYGKLQGDIKVTKDKNGNYNLSYTQVLEYDRLKSAVMGVGDIPARRETTHTTYVFNSEGKRITNTRNVETEYLKSAKVPTQSEDWTGANANMGTTRTAQRRLKNAMKWGKLQSAKR